MRPSTARIRSPGLRMPAAAEPGVVSSILLIGFALRTSPIDQYSPIRITNARKMLTAGPAAMTTSRFHTGWR